MRHVTTRTILTALMLAAAAAPRAGAVAVTAEPDSHAVEGSAFSSAAVIGDSSDSYRMSWAAGEVAVSEGQSPSYRLSVGFWTGCVCPFQSDFDSDGFTTAIDLAAVIDILFAGSPDLRDPACPTTRGDFDCDGFSTALDLSGLIDHLFAGGDGPCDPCSL